MAFPHKWKFVFETGVVSRDSFEQCAVCGALRHSYSYDQGNGEPPIIPDGWPRVFHVGYEVHPTDCPMSRLINFK